MRISAPLLLAIGLAASCTPEAPRSERILGVLGRAKALHLRAARLHRAGHIPEAVQALEAVAALKFPPSAPEARDVRIDALVEAGRIWLSAHRVQRAERVIRRAIALGGEPTYFLGLAYLRLGDVLRARGRTKEAVLAFERSIEVNRSVLHSGKAVEKVR